jgi:hypothetical protein
MECVLVCFKNLVVLVISNMQISIEENPINKCSLGSHDEVSESTQGGVRIGKKPPQKTPR